MELLGNVIVLASSLVCLAATGSGAWSEARSAIAVTQALSVCGLLNWTVRTIACLGLDGKGRLEKVGCAGVSAEVEVGRI